jgi:hypothetical protein
MPAQIHTLATAPLHHLSTKQAAIAIACPSSYPNPMHPCAILSIVSPVQNKAMHPSRVQTAAVTSLTPLQAHHDGRRL